ncbi:MAG: TadE family type IV pilus minor pilin [Nesterenkonia sp.]
MAETARCETQRGSVTAEFALGLPAVVLVLMLVLGLAMHGAARVTLEDGARAGARELARGESAAAAEQSIRTGVDEDVTVTITKNGEYTHVVLTQPVEILGLVQVSAEIAAEASARTEHLADLEAAP